VIHLLDASVLITAHNTYYGLARVPEYWEWLKHHGTAGSIKLHPENYAEVADGNDALAAWMKEAETKEALLLKDDLGDQHIQTVLARYGNPLSEADILTIGKDPFLIAAALASPADRCVVTAEVSRPGRVGANRHIPDVCHDCRVRCMTPIDLLNALNFTTGWKG
jgi:hypothetical protein